MLALDHSYLRDARVPAGTIQAAALLLSLSASFPLPNNGARRAGSIASFSENQPISFVTRSAQLILLATGIADHVVNRRNSEALAAKLASAGVPVEFKIYPGKSNVDLSESLS